jgi:hypothetical protein
MLILIANPVKLIDVVNGTGAGDTFALPIRSVVLAWQTAFDTAPSAISITLEVSIDALVWTVLDTSTDVSGEVRTIQDPTAALFIRANVGTNTGNKFVTVTLVAKVANP